MDFEKEPASVAEGKSIETDTAVEIPENNNKDEGKQTERNEINSSSFSNFNEAAIVNKPKSKKGKLGLVLGIAGALVVASAVAISLLIFNSWGKKINSEDDNLFKCGLLAVCNSDDKWGFVDATGKYIINPQFDNTYGFNDSGLAAVKIGEKYGYIDTSGKFVINPQFDLAGSFDEKTGLARVAVINLKTDYSYGYSHGYIDKTGAYVINPQFDDAYSFGCKGLAIVKSGEKYGYIDKSGSFVINPQFDEAREFDEITGLAVVGKLVEKGDYSWNDVYSYGLINEKGNYVVNPQFNDIDSFSENGLAVAKSGEKYGYINSEGKYVISPQFDGAWSFDNISGLAPVAILDNDGNKKWGYINSTGSYVINSQFDLATNFTEDGLASVRIGDKYGYIDMTGSYVINPQFNYAGSFNNGLAFVGQINKNGKYTYGFIDKSGSYANNLQFESAGYNYLSYGMYFMDDGYSLFVSGEMYGVIDRTGKIVVNPQFKYLR